MNERKQLKKITEVQQILLKEQRKYRPTQAAYRRIQTACDHLARARFAYVDDPSREKKMAKAQQVLDRYGDRGTRGVAFGPEIL